MKKRTHAIKASYSVSKETLGLAQQLWKLDLPAQIKVTQKDTEGCIMFPEAELKIAIQKSKVTDNGEGELSEFRKNIMNKHKHSVITVSNALVKNNAKVVASYIYSVYQNRMFTYEDEYPE